MYAHVLMTLLQMDDNPNLPGEDRAGTYGHMRRHFFGPCLHFFLKTSDSRYPILLSTPFIPHEMRF